MLLRFSSGLFKCWRPECYLKAHRVISRKYKVLLICYLFMTLMGLFEGNHITEHHYSAVSWVSVLVCTDNGVTFSSSWWFDSSPLQLVQHQFHFLTAQIVATPKWSICLFGFYLFASLRELRCRRVCSFLRLRDFKSGCVDRDMREIQGRDTVSSLIRLNICERETGSYSSFTLVDSDLPDIIKLNAFYRFFYHYSDGEAQFHILVSLL